MFKFKINILALFGQLAQLIPRVYTYYISAALFAFFGLKMLKEGWYMKDSDAQEELEEVQSELKKREDQVEKCVIFISFHCNYHPGVDGLLFNKLNYLTKCMSCFAKNYL